jgi:hypothetical protein
MARHNIRLTRPLRGASILTLGVQYAGRIPSEILRGDLRTGSRSNKFGAAQRLAPLNQARPAQKALGDAGGFVEAELV